MELQTFCKEEEVKAGTRSLEAYHILTLESLYKSEGHRPDIIDTENCDVPCS
jgi:hypothetical protein